ncbi:MAG TPA: glycoside hydrolase family 38 C-terminal domain-containing protein [Acidimicrobiales bacterium]|nr:glycoside hydrolase family 38 C-terminal domain-containing protein [Acidimicrobiales bacterium]
MAPRRVNIVPHTHWDREWYSPFQKFRMRLVEMVDELLPLLDADASYSHFLLDGQMAVVDDYLEVRPQAAAVLRRLASEGRLAMGPWYSLPDEFLVSGETIIRNLQAGIARAAEFGGAMDVGYLPDMFGHVSQMPQIFRLFGFEHAVVWRGVPNAVERTAFMWSSPDGSTVRAEYLWRGYGNGARTPKDSKELLQRIADYEELTHAAMDGRNPARPEPMLWMNGSDHLSPDPWLGQVIAEANAAQQDFDLHITPLADHLRMGPTKDLPKWTGELRSGGRANLLMGVTSNRTDVRLLAARAERCLERLAEPLSALFLPAQQWPGELLAIAWREMLRNAAHDSICACSHDDVVDAVVVRFQEARHIGEGLTYQAKRAIAAQCPSAGAIVINPSAKTRSGLVEIEVPGEGPVSGAQIVDERPSVRGEITFTADKIGALLSRLRSQRIDDDTYFYAVDIEATDAATEISLRARPFLREWLDLDAVKRDIAARAAAEPDKPIKMRITQNPTRRLVCRIDEIPGFGWRRWTGDASRVLPVSVDGETMNNGLLTVTVDRVSGTLTVNGIEGFDRLVDGGDQGDTYNYSPPDNDTIIDTPSSIDVRVLESGPLRARLQVTRSYAWPARVDDATRSRVGKRRVGIRTVYELQAGERMVRVRTTFDNPSRDHRLRTMLPLPSVATGSRADCAFAVPERSLRSEGGAHERELPTHPAKRFVQAGGLTAIVDGVTEYEVIDAGKTLALTLLRASAMLSRIEMTYRPQPAGPPNQLRGSQMLGPVEAHYAIAFGDVDPFALADDFLLPLEVAIAGGDGPGSDSGQALAVTGAEVSSVQRVPGGIEVRLWNPSDQESTAVITDGVGWVVDLRGRPLRAFEGDAVLKSWEILTVRMPHLPA